MHIFVYLQTLVHVNYADAKRCTQQHDSVMVTEIPRSQQVLPLLRAIIQAQLHIVP